MGLGKAAKSGVLAGGLGQVSSGTAQDKQSHTVLIW
jgi:hypothetical protein